MVSLNGFNANEVDPAQPSREMLPTGDYIVAITDSESKRTKRGDGAYLALTFEVLEGDCAGIKIWHNLNLQNPNAMAVKISEAQLSAICHAVKIMQPRDTEELHNIPIKISVTLKPRSDDPTKMENKITKFVDRDDGFVPPPKAAIPSSGAVHTSPWGKGKGV